MHAQRRQRRGIASVSIAASAVAALAVAVAASPASAGQVERWHDHVTDSHIEQEVHGEDFCGGFDYPVLWEGEGTYTGHAVSRGGGPVYFGETVKVVDTYTNTVTGASMVDSFTGRNHDLKITDNGDGTLTITGTSQGMHVLRSAGEVVAREAGTSRFRLLVDHGGTPDDPSDDTFLQVLGTDKDTGLNQFEGRDFCEDLHLLLD